MKRFLHVLLAICCSFSGLQAQYIRCATDEHQAALDAANPAQRAIREQANYILSQMDQHDVGSRGQLIVTIPVVFHVLYANASQNIPDAKLFEQLDVLNKDYSRTNTDAGNTRVIFQGVAVNTQIQFCLAKRTPQNAPTTGIVRISTPTFPNNPHSVSPEWDHTKYLNIYIGDLGGGGILGYSNLPPGTTGSDHVVILYSAIGGPNNPGSATPYHLGRTASHEVGHWLNLWHTFQNGCSGTNANTCGNSGDEVCDTPPVGSANFGCPAGNPNSCTEVSPFPPPYTSNMPDMYENYMDYTDDACMNAFTQGQSTRMNNAINQLRSALLTSQGCVPVGIEEALDPSYMIVSPNPSDGFFTVNFNFPVSTDIDLSVTDISGRLVYDDRFEKTKTASTIINLSDHAEGVYLLNAETPNGRVVKRLVIAR
jgi:hypothetical protein